MAVREQWSMGVSMLIQTHAFERFRQSHILIWQAPKPLDPRDRGYCGQRLRACQDNIQKETMLLTSNGIVVVVVIAQYERSSVYPR